MAPGTDRALERLRAAEARLLARRDGPPDPAAAVAEALAEACGAAIPPGFAAAGRAIAAAVEAHGAAFPEGAEPAYHDRHHQAEATLAAGWLAGEARRAGLLEAREGGRIALAMAGHDLGHDGRAGDHAPGALERRSAEATDRLAAPHLPDSDRAGIFRLILATTPEAPTPDDLAGRLVREADLFASLTPGLGWRLSRALAAEMARAGLPEAACARIASHAGRLALLRWLPPVPSPPARALGLEATRAAQLAALARLDGAGTPEAGAALLDALPAEAGMRRWWAALGEREPPA